MKKHKLNVPILLIYILIIGISSFFLYNTRVVSRIEQDKLISEYENKKETEEKLLENLSGKSKEGSPREFLMKPAGVLYAPSIDLKILVYDSVDEIALTEGAGIVPGTGDLSVTKGQNTLITSHNGAATKDLFMNLEKMKDGDEFFIKTDDGINKYEVFHNQVLKPDEEIENFLEPTSEDILVTLRTCVPTMINSHRLHVTGRYAGKVELLEDIPKASLTISKFEILMTGFLILGLYLLVSEIVNTKKKKGEDFKDEY